MDSICAHNEFTAVIEPPTEDDHWFIAYCPEIPGANGQGKTKEEAKRSLAEGIVLLAGSGTRNGKWHGPFATLKVAEEAATRTRGNVSHCKHYAP